MRYSDCRLGAAFALHAHSVSDELQDVKTKLMKLAEGIAEVCHAMTQATPTGLPKKSFYIETNKTNSVNPYWILPVMDGEPYNLEPELLETYFVLYRITGNEKYRDYAWEYVEVLYRHARSKEGAFFGEAGQTTKNKELPVKLMQEPVFFSGTLKYLYLTFAESWVLPLDEWIFNSLGHPLPVHGLHPAFTESLN